MSHPRHPEKVKLMASIFSADDGLIGDAIRIMAEKYGGSDYISAPLPFGYTGYYESEFGARLVRRFISFEGLIGADELPDVKLWTNKLEEELAVSEKRRVNIDPGYISAAHLILATGKGYSHRPYLRDGIYADLTLMYRKGGFETLPWTYPDYAEKKTILMLSRIRDKYLLQLREEAGGNIMEGGTLHDQKHDGVR